MNKHGEALSECWEQKKNPCLKLSQRISLRVDHMICLQWQRGKPCCRSTHCQLMVETLNLRTKRWYCFYTHMWNQTAYKAASILFLRFLHPDNLVTCTCAGLHLLLLSLFNVSPSFFSTAFLILLSGALILATDLLCHQSLCIHVHCVHVCMFVF